MNSKLGLSSFAHYWAVMETSSNQDFRFSACDLLDKVTKLELEVLQICENLPLVGWTAQDLKHLRNAAQCRGVTLEIGARGLDVDNLKAHMRIADSLGAHLMRFTPWSGSDTQQPGLKDKLCRVVDQLLPLCWEYDLTLGIENYFDLPDAELASFVRQVNDKHIGICLDTANSVGLLEKPLETVRLLAPYVVSVHLKDFVVTKPTMGFVISGVPLGHGWLDVQAVQDAINQTGRQPNILLELWVAPAENMEATLEKEDEWVRLSVSYARQHLHLHQVTKPEIHN